MAANSDKQHLAVECPKCRQPTVATVEGTVWVSESDFLVSLTECARCERPVLVGQTVDYPDNIGPARRLWPSPARQLPWEAPHHLRQAYAEAESCYSQGNYTAAAMMARRCLEGLAKELGGKGRTLAAKLKNLRQSEVINEQLYEWATELKQLGNVAAHETDRRISEQDADDVLIFTEALAEYVYTFKQKFEAFQERQGRGRSTSA